MKDVKCEWRARHALGRDVRRSAEARKRPSLTDLIKSIVTRRKRILSKFGILGRNIVIARHFVICRWQFCDQARPGLPRHRGIDTRAPFWRGNYRPF